MNIHLKDVDINNWVDCIKLSLHPYQEKSLASNSVTIAESKYEKHHRLRAIYKGDTIIGMLSFCHETQPLDLELYWLFRFMIDQNYQRKGYGTKVLDILKNEVKSLGGKRLQTMCKPNNILALNAYKKYGFEEVGTLEDGDILFELKLFSYINT